LLHFLLPIKLIYFVYYAVAQLSWKVKLKRNNGSDEHERKRNLITSIIDSNNVKLCESFGIEREIKRFITLNLKEIGRARKKGFDTSLKSR